MNNRLVTPTTRRLASIYRFNKYSLTYVKHRIVTPTTYQITAVYRFNNWSVFNKYSPIFINNRFATLATRRLHKYLQIFVLSCLPYICRYSLKMALSLRLHRLNKNMKKSLIIALSLQLHICSQTVIHKLTRYSFIIIL